MFQYLNELTYYYISAGSADTAQEWVRMMRQCVNKKPKVSRNEVQQIRSLVLQIKECKLSNKLAHAQIICRIALDNCFIASTRPLSTENICVFDESYRFEDLQPYSDVVSIEVTALKKGTFWPAKDANIGSVEFNLSKLPNGQDLDQWHTFPNVRASKGSLRLIATFKHEVILPSEEYRGLSETILSDDLVIIETLSKVCNEHHSELAGILIELFCHHQKVLPLLSKCLARAIDREDNVSTLFRASTVATMLMDQFMKLLAMDYLLSILRQPIQFITTSTEPCELNPGYLPRGTDTAKNQENLESHISLVLNEIYNSVNICPLPLRYLFHCLQEQVALKWPSDQGVRTRAVSAFLFLRFICPALLKPHLFNLVSDPPSQTSDRSLKLVTKTVQNVANLIEFKGKEPFMGALNTFIKKQMVKMRGFIDAISNVSELPKVNHPSSDPARAWASLYRLCCTYEHKLKEYSQKEKQVMELLSVMQILKATEERYLNTRSGLVNPTFK
jgi:Ras GTPase-activating protein 1